MSMKRRVRAPAAGLCWALSLISAQAFDLQGHRGARGLAPENTLAAFAKALAIGVDTLELDVGMTKDGVLVVAHDPRLNPNLARLNGAFLEGAGPALRDLTLAELKRYDVGRLKPGTPYARAFPEQAPADGATIPTLAEVFALARGTTVRFNVETKITPNSGADAPDPDGFVHAVVETARKAGVIDRITIQSFDWRTLQAASRIAPDIPRVCLTSEAETFDTVAKGRPGGSAWTGFDANRFAGSVPRLVKAAGCSAWSPRFADLTEEAVREAKAEGLRVIPWTVNEPADAERLIHWGVDGLISDYPDRMRKVLAANGMDLPPPVRAP